jgi:hypothetical protein
MAEKVELARIDRGRRRALAVDRRGEARERQLIGSALDGIAARGSGVEEIEK